MFDKSPENPPIPAYLRFVTAVECCVVFTAAFLLFFLPSFSEDLWAWTIPPFNARFVGAVYFAAYIPLIIFWLNPRWTPGRLVLWMIFVFTVLVMAAMFLHADSFAWDRPAAFLVFWPLYIFLPINSAVFLYKFRNVELKTQDDLSPAWKTVLKGFALLAGLYGIGLFFAPEALTRFWPWHVDAFHAHIYASAFVTPAVGAWILSGRRGAASEYLTFGLNLLTGGILPILGTLITNLSLPPERQADFGGIGTGIFFLFFLATGILGALQIRLAFQTSNKMGSK
ncbi:MAG: hypothetical protein DPW18_16825 [Chloroflexi bacterium]|nr:hypothetical protein [Chloroflexota bacterium]MDL1944628.1 hypothetical protein [Chloroflexi bacterium CFX2]